MIKDKDLDNILMNRQCPEPSLNLSHRIMASAKKATSGAWDSLTLTQTMVRLFIIPKPAYVTACLLCIGVLLGVSMQGSDVSNQDLFTFLDVEQEEWL